MSSPTEGTDTPRPSAIWGSMPMTTNSVVPMPNAPTDRGSSARGTGKHSRRQWAGGHDVRRTSSSAGGAGPPGARAGAAPGFPGDGCAPSPGRGGSGLEQHLHGAVLLLAEVGVRLRRLLERHPVGREVID